MSTRVRAAPVRRRPTVSVVVPHYNYGAFLPIAVRSVLDQVGVDIEVIVVDDASTDGSLEVARALAASHPRVTLVEHARNQRHIATYNDGIARAAGDYLVLLSADDMLAPGSLARATALMESDPTIGLVYGHVETIGDDVLEVEPQPRGRTGWTRWDGREWIARVCGQGRNVIVSPEVVMRRGLLQELGGYDARLPHSGDLYLWLRAAARGAIGRVNGPVQAYYRVHGTNMHTTEFAGVRDYEAVRDAFDAFVDADASLLADPEGVRRIARRALSREVLRRTALLGGRRAEAAELLRFSHDLDPSDRIARGAYRTLARTGALPALRGVEQLRWKVRYHRQLRFGT
jgi:glycosyltransferase involved in cell wall biosynthesis